MITWGPLPGTVHASPLIRNDSLVEHLVRSQSFDIKLLVSELGHLAYRHIFIKGMLIT